MTIEIKTLILLAITAAIALLIHAGWEKGNRSNKIIADIVGFIAAMIYVYSSAFIDSDPQRFAILVVAALFIIFLIVRAPVQHKVKAPDVPPPMPEPESESEPEPEVSVVEVTSANVEPEPEETVSVTPAEEEAADTYQDGLIGAPVKKEKTPEPVKAAVEEKKEPQDAYEQFIIEKLSDSSAQRNMGIKFMEEGNSDEAIKKWREAIKINADDFKAHALIADALKETGRLDGAMEEYTKVIKINPKHSAAHYALGFEHSARGQLHNAIGSFESFIKCAAPRDSELVGEVERMIEYLNAQLNS